MKRATTVAFVLLATWAAQVQAQGMLASNVCCNNVTTSVGTLTLKGGLLAGDAGTDVTVTSTTTRAAGSLFDLQNNTSSRFRIAFDGVLNLDTSPNGQTLNLALKGNGNRITFDPSNSGQFKWKIGSNDSVANGLEFTPTTAAGGTTYTTPLLTLINQAAGGTGNDVLINPQVTRTGGSIFNITNNGAAIFRVAPTGIGLGSTLGSALVVEAANTGLNLLGNKVAGDASTDVVVNSSVTRTAGNLLDVQNNASSRLTLAFDGTTSWPNVAALKATGSNAGLTLKGNKAAGDGGTDVIVNTAVTRTAGGLFEAQNNGASKFLIALQGDILTGSGVFAPTLTANSSVQLLGNKSAGDTGTDVILYTVVTRTAGNLVQITNNGSDKVLINTAGKITFPQAGASTGSPGAATINQAAGRSAIAAGASTVVITNNLVSATSIVFAVLQATDSTATFIKSVIPASGSFTVTVNANATATLPFGWVVFN